MMCYGKVPPKFELMGGTFLDFRVSTSRRTPHTGVCGGGALALSCYPHPGHPDLINLRFSDPPNPPSKGGVFQVLWARGPIDFIK